MVTLVKHEWHSHDRQYALELDADLLSEIYPDLDEDEIAEKLQQIENGEIDVEDVMNDAYDNDVEIEWDFQYDDCWTDRKGGYDVTYEVGDDDSWHSEPEPEPPTHKCTHCKWEGSEYEADWVWKDKDGTDLDEAKRVCKYCESDIQFTEFGAEKDKERTERYARWEQEAKDAEEEVPCFSCGAMHKESDLPELSGQYHCPDCHEGWVMMEFREEESDDSVVEEADQEIVAQLQELKDEFDRLSVAPADDMLAAMKCTKCEWTGDWCDTHNDEIDGEAVDTCPECGAKVVDLEVELEPVEDTPQECPFVEEPKPEPAPKKKSKK